MAVSVRTTSEGIHILRVRGKLTGILLDELTDALNPLGAKALVVINLKGARMADSVSVGYLLRRHGILYQSGGGMALCCLPPDIQKLISLAGLHRHFALHNSEDEAVAALKASYAAASLKPKKRGRKPKDKKPE